MHGDVQRPGGKCGELEGVDQREPLRAAPAGQGEQAVVEALAVPEARPGGADAHGGDQNQIRQPERRIRPGRRDEGSGGVLPPSRAGQGTHAGPGSERPKAPGASSS